MRKPRSDSKLLNLPEEQRDEILQMMLSGQPYHVVQKLIAGDPFKLSVSLSSLSSFYGHEAPKRLIQNRLNALRIASEIKTEAEKNPGRFDAATIEALTQRAFEIAINPTAAADDVSKLFSLVLKSRDQDLAARRLKVLEDKAKQADKAKDVSDSPLSAEEKQTRLKQIFGAA
jgi:hypothetical protein